jgi:PBP1b-binding outer membrane lipoprotein LpoB
MKKALFVMAMLLVLSLVVTGCSKQEVEDQQNNTTDSTEQTSGTGDNPDEYIDEQIIDENSTIEIGEMI